jgi:hypothetical protein
MWAASEGVEGRNAIDAIVMPGHLAAAIAWTAQRAAFFVAMSAVLCPDIRKEFRPSELSGPSPL